MTYPQVPTLSSASLDELRRGLAAEDFTSVDLVKAYITRIEEVQAQLKPVIEINRDAFRVALRLDEERKHGKARGYKYKEILCCQKPNAANWFVAGRCMESPF